MHLIVGRQGERSKPPFWDCQDQLMREEQEQGWKERGENKQQQLEAVEKLNEIVDWATNGGSDKAKELVELIFVCRNL